MPPRKKPLNAYFQMMLEAKRKEAPSFSYKGQTYVRRIGKNGLVVYRKQ